MKIYCDWIVKNEEQRIESSLRSLLPYIDYAMVVDTGSTDTTLDIVGKIQKDFSYLHVTKDIDIGPNYMIDIARNTSLRLVPIEFWTKETTWYGVIAGDEVYDKTATNLKTILEKIPPECMWVYTWGRDWHTDKNGKLFIRNNKFGRPTFYRHVDGMFWHGCWNRERIVYPKLGSYFQYERSGNPGNLMCLDADLWYDHYGWADNKAEMRSKIYAELAYKEKIGEIPNPHK